MKDKIIKLLDDWKLNKHKQELIADELLILCGVVDSEAELPELLCRMNSNFKCNCIDNTRCPNFT